MILIRCECGQALGKVSGKYEIRCHKCKKIMAGEVISPKDFYKGRIDEVDRKLFGKPRIPRELIPVR